MSEISSTINQIGEAYGLQNVFPVPYYRKIMLEQRGKFRISKLQQIKNHNYESEVIQADEIKINPKNKNESSFKD